MGHVRRFTCPVVTPLLLLAALAGCSRIDGNYSLDPRGQRVVTLLLPDGSSIEERGRAPIWVEPRFAVTRSTVSDAASGLTTSSLTIAMGAEAGKSASLFDNAIKYAATFAAGLWAGGAAPSGI